MQTYQLEMAIGWKRMKPLVCVHEAEELEELEELEEPVELWLQQFKP